MEKVMIKFAEIALKGKNRYIFEKQLVDNIKSSADYFGLNLVEFQKEKHRFTVIYDNTREEVAESLKTVYGIEYFSFVDELPKSLNDVLMRARKFFTKFKKDGVSDIAFKTKRADKGFELKSPELNAELGQIASEEFGLKINYREPEVTLFTEIQFKAIFMHTEKVKGAGGLPVGSSGGKALVLLSGGIDSPVAAASIMKRGMRCDFLHFHVFLKNEFAAEGKVSELRKILDKFQFESKLYLIPYSVYELGSSGKIWDRFELIFFKHYIFRVACEVAKKYGYDVVVSGDNLNQVASQTLPNILCTEFGLDVSVFRPLLTYDKEEIVNMAKNIGTYDLSIEDYKDCCSIASKNPMTQTKLEKFMKVLERSPIEELVEESLKELEEY